MKEASELSNTPSADYHAAPLENDIFEWHFTLRGPPAPSHYDGGIYHGRIVLPPAYPMKPPTFRFTTPTGRFEVNREICLSISGHHEETWQPAWGIRTALVAIRSFMDTDAKGQLGGMDASEEVRRRFAKQSPQYQCAACAKTNAEIMKEQDVAVEAAGVENASKSETLPPELRLAYREDLTQSSAVGSVASAGAPATPATTAVEVVPAPQPLRPHLAQDTGVPPAWVDKAIYAVLAALVALLWFRYVA